jgi:hypothetical protein
MSVMATLKAGPGDPARTAAAAARGTIGTAVLSRACQYQCQWAVTVRQPGVRRLDCRTVPPASCHGARGRRGRRGQLQPTAAQA